MARVSQPELKRYLDKKVVINIQGGRRVQGTLRGFDVFLNLVVDDTMEYVRPEGAPNAWKEAAQCGTVVSLDLCYDSEHGTDSDAAIGV
jgi:small nuclear ribonucleoprotein G